MKGGKTESPAAPPNETRNAALCSPDRRRRAAACCRGSSLAGTITVTIQTPTLAPCTGAWSCTKTYIDTDANLTKIVTDYGPNCQAQNLTGSPPVPTACSPTQVLAFWVNSIIAGTAALLNINENNAALQATVLPTPIIPQ